MNDQICQKCYISMDLISASQGGAGHPDPDLIFISCTEAKYKCKKCGLTLIITEKWDGGIIEQARIINKLIDDKHRPWWKQLF